MADLLAESLNKIKTYENLGREECIVASTGLVKNVLATLKQNGYVTEIEEVEGGKFRSLRVMLANKINNIGVVKPRHAVKVSEYQKYERRYIPSKDFGLLIMSTPAGIMSNREAKEKRMGGRLIAYVY
ncbi:MAG: 30S ribosomal protein S8 [Candidatus Marsarchaeota archaeon]|nr:30S ribosomal protein S8 [Candidatus Marsarchaeota archaeon]